MNFAHDSAKNTRRMEERRDLEYSYKTCRLSTDTKDTIGRIYDAYSAKGGERAYFCSVLETADLWVPPRTLDHWRLNLRSHGYVVSPSKATGAHRLLTPSNEELFVGFAYDEYCNNRELHLDNALDFLSKSLFVSMDESTACRYLNNNGFFASCPDQTSRFCRFR